MINKLFFSLLLLCFFNMNSQILNWNTNIDNAIQVSIKEHKPMLLLFTNNKSDKGALEELIFNTLDFAVWARDSVILVRVDLTDDTSNELLEHNLNLKKAFGVEDLPTICYSKPTIQKNKVTYHLLGKTAYMPGSIKSWIANSTQLLNTPIE